MRASDFDYELPRELIAQQPLAERSASRMLCVDGRAGTFTDAMFRELPDWLRPGDLLVFNDTRVIPARLIGRKATGGRVEVLVERVPGEHEALAHVRASRSPREGAELCFEGDARATVNGRQGTLFALRFAEPVLTVLERAGHMPLPPYIERADTDADRERYQTVYARHPGAVAAPTAGLHFDEAMLARLDAMGVERASVTLHVGAGTFQPMRADKISEHSMHAERLEVSEACCRQVRAARSRGDRVVAVGTTAVRALEAASAEGRIEPVSGETELFIHPGYRFRAVDALLTNFHLPQSTLLMLVCAFAGTPTVMAAYRHAVAERYRFFSYGDAMLALPHPQALADDRPEAPGP